MEDQGERFHLDVRDIERLYEMDVNMLADYCRMLKQETVNGRRCVRRSIKRGEKNVFTSKKS
jgi:hypothetical protein